jgi:hypothetical protein
MENTFNELNGDRQLRRLFDRGHTLAQATSKINSIYFSQSCVFLDESPTS